MHNKKKTVGFIIVNIFLFICFYFEFSNAQTWQEVLEQRFDLVDTFDYYEDWVGNSASVFSKDPNQLPKFSKDLSSGTLWKRYAYNPNGERDGEGKGGPWIGNHGIEHQVGTKGLKLHSRGYGGLEVMTYLGDGTGSAGYEEIYVFFRAYFPKNAFPTNTDPADCKGNGAVQYIQSVFDSTGYLWTTGSKFVNFGTGFTSVDTHSTSTCHYGDGAAWFNFSNSSNDKGMHPDITGIGCFDVPGKKFCPADTCKWPPGAKSVGFDMLGAIEIRAKVESYIGEEVNQYGEFDIWWYDSLGKSTQISGPNQVTFMNFEDVGHLINRVSINGNKHRYDGTGPPTDPPNYNCSVGEYTINNNSGMSRFFYIDDFIIDNARIGPDYFELINIPVAPKAKINQIVP